MLFSLKCVIDTKEETVKKYSICHICSYYETPIFCDLVANQKEFTNSRVFYYQYYGHSFFNGDAENVDRCPCYNYIDRFFFFVKQNKAIKNYKRIYVNYKFDLNFSHSLFTNGYVAYTIKKEWGTPYIVTIQNTDLNIFFKYIVFLRKLGVEILRNASSIIISSKSYEETLLKKYIPSKYHNEIQEKIHIVPYGIDNFYSSHKNVNRKEMDKNIRILSVGRINRNKNQLLICKATKQLINQGYPIHVDIVGPCVQPYLLKKIQKYDFVSYFDYMSKEQLIEKYREATIFVLTSKTETFGLVYAEALSQGLPIIYTKGEGFVGFHTRLNPNDLVCAIKKVINSYNIIQNQCVHASIKYDWDRINSFYKEIYQDSLS